MKTRITEKSSNDKKVMGIGDKLLSLEIFIVSYQRLGAIINAMQRSHFTSAVVFVKVSTNLKYLK